MCKKLRKHWQPVTGLCPLTFPCPFAISDATCRTSKVTASPTHTLCHHNLLWSSNDGNHHAKTAILLGLTGWNDLEDARVLHVPHDVGRPAVDEAKVVVVLGIAVATIR